ncbi:hypothetical protein KRMM14A1004_49060 [Krasilnikovia sp. MM14-A1004]
MVVSEPSGFATVTEDSSVSAAIGTDSDVFLALAIAAATGPAGELAGSGAGALAGAGFGTEAGADGGVVGAGGAPCAGVASPTALVLSTAAATAAHGRRRRTRVGDGDMVSSEPFLGANVIVRR